MSIPESFKMRFCKLFFAGPTGRVKNYFSRIHYKKKTWRWLPTQNMRHSSIIESGSASYIVREVSSVFGAMCGQVKKPFQVLLFSTPSPLPRFIYCLYSSLVFSEEWQMPLEPFAQPFPLALSITFELVQ